MPVLIFARKLVGNYQLFRDGKMEYFQEMSTVQEIEAAIPKLPRTEIEKLRDWIDDLLEDQLELTDEVKAKVEESKREISEGKYTMRKSA